MAERDDNPNPLAMGGGTARHRHGAFFAGLFERSLSMERPRSSAAGTSPNVGRGETDIIVDTENR